jgi:predicted homoserine dehydrogenase-like protein
MIYEQLFERLTPGRRVRAGVIGTGSYAMAVITQAQVIPQLDVSVVCDRDIEAARRAYHHAGLDDDNFVICDSRRQAAAALEQGKRVIVADSALVMELPVDVVVESTGVPEASARHAAQAIEYGKHVAMVSKEADSAVGPILKYRADRAGLVYTAVDGDQHGLLIGLVQWARGLGLEVICGGKAIDTELVFDGMTVSRRQIEIPIDPALQHLFAAGNPAETIQHVAQRQVLLGAHGRIGGWDITEMTIAANAANLAPDLEELHAPILRVPEIPEVMAPVEEGGILGQRGVIDSIVCLRGPFEAGLGGGVFVVVGCENDYSRDILVTKGLIPNSRNSTALIFRPYHLCGVETPISILVAGLLGIPTGGRDYLPRYDVLARTTEDMPAGERIGNDHSPKLQAIMRPAQTVQAGSPVPLHMANGNRLAADVPAGTLLAADMLDVSDDSVLWALRAEQDRVLLGQA